MGASILVVDPDPLTAKVLSFALADAGYRATALADPRRLVASLGGDAVDLVLLEATLPHVDGVAVCTEIHRAHPAVIVVMLSAHASFADRVAGLNAGADDYVAKPFDPEELLARVQALLRRVRWSKRNVRGMTIRAGDATLDLAEMRFAAPGRESAPLTPTEMKILGCLMRNAGAVIARERLIERTWGYDYEGGSNRVDVYIRRLRQKIEPNGEGPSCLETVRGIGYRFYALMGTAVSAFASTNASAVQGGRPHSRRSGEDRLATCSGEMPSGRGRPGG